MTFPTTATIGQKPLWEDQDRTPCQTVFPGCHLCQRSRGVVTTYLDTTFPHTSRARRKLRHDIFRRIAQSAQLQHQLLEVLANHPKTQRNVVMELAKDPQFRRRLMVLAGQQTDGPRRRLSKQC